VNAIAWHASRLCVVSINNSWLPDLGFLHNPLCDQHDFHYSEDSDPEDQEMYGEKHYTNFLPSHPLDDNYDLIGYKDRAGSARVVPSDVHKVKMPTTVRRIRRTTWTKTGGRR